MDKHDFLQSLYIGRKVDRIEFNHHFYMNGVDSNEYIAEIEDEYGIVILTIYVELEDDILADMDIVKEEETCGHGRPEVTSIRILVGEYKLIYEILDVSFPYLFESELYALVDNAIKIGASYKGYSIKKRSSTKLTYVNQIGKSQTIDLKVCRYMLEKMHQDLRILRSVSYFSEACALFSKKDWEPLFAVIQCAEPEKFENYEELENKYRREELLLAIDASDLDKCEEYKDAIAYLSNASELFERAIEKGKLEVIDWLLQHINEYKVDLCGAIYSAINTDNYSLLKKLLATHAYDAEKCDSDSWRTPMYAAVSTNDKYVKALLKHGFLLPDRLGSKLYKDWSMSKIVSRSIYNVLFDQETINRIVKANRMDIINLMLAENRVTALNMTVAYIKNKNYEEFCKWIEMGGIPERPEDFVQAFNNGNIWADQLIENGFDINVKDGYLMRYAAEELAADLFIYLLEHGADPFYKKPYSQTAYEKVIGYHGYLGRNGVEAKSRMCLALFNRGMYPLSEDRVVLGDIGYLLGKEVTNDVKYVLIEWLAENNMLNKVDTNKHLPISYFLKAIESKADIEILNLFINNGTLLNAESISDDLLFIKSCGNGNCDAIGLLVDNGAHVHEIEHGVNGLFSAVWNGASLKVIKLLVESGVDVNSYKPTKIVEQMWDYKPRIIPGCSVLDAAYKKGDKSIIDYLISKGAKKCSELES